MSLPLFFYFFIPLLLGCVAFARQWLPALLVFSTCLQAASVLNVPIGEGFFGVSPYSITALFAFLLLTVRAFRQHALPCPSQSLRTATALLAAYAVIAIAGAFVLPHLHAGVPVYLLLNKFGFDRGTTPLHFTVSNLVQAINLAIHVCVLAFLLQARTFSESVGSKMLIGFSAATALVLGIGFYERMATFGWWESFNVFWMSNPGYAQLHDHTVAGFRRIVAPFSEASYATTFLAAVWVGLLAVCLFGRARRWQLAATLVVGIGLINPLGSTGWVAAGLVAFAVLLLATALALFKRLPNGYAAVASQFGEKLTISTHSDADRRSTLRKRVLAAWTLILCLVLSGCWAWKMSPAAPKIQAVVDTVLLKKLEGGSAKVRHRSNEQALQIVKDTYGMGAGLGSNRASSYFASLVSNTGIAGLLCFVGMLAALSWRYATADALQDGQIFAIASLWTATIAVGLAIPDLNIPLYWAFIFLAFLLCPESGRNTNAGKAPV